MYYSTFSITGIEGDKIIILIKLKIIRMSESTLIFIRKNYQQQLIPFITRNIEKYTEEVINEDNFDLNETLSVLEEKVNEKYKVKLLGLTSDEISLKQKRYSNAVKLHILKHNLDVSDIPFLLSCYPKENDNVKAAIKSILIDHIADILDEKCSIPFELLSELLVLNQLEMEAKKELLVLCLPEMSETQVKECLSTLQMNEFLCLFDQKRPKVKASKINKQILTIFKEKYWITKFDIDKNDPDYYRAFGRKIQDNSLRQSAS